MGHLCKAYLAALNAGSLEEIAAFLPMTPLSTPPFMAGKTPGDFTPNFFRIHPSPSRPTS